MDIYLTLDYELFLNDISGDVEHCLIIPGNALLDLCDRQGIKATFFVDAAYLLRLRELQSEYPVLQQDLAKVLDQIRDIVRRGHSIGLHIHSQWYYSTFDGDKWTIDFEHYKLSDMPLREADEKFQSSLDLLNSIANTEIKSFRGGGFSIQDYSSFPAIMIKNGIVNDTTATYKGKLKTKLHNYDYSTLKSSDHYHFNEDITVPEENGVMTEYPIATVKENYLVYCYKRFRYSKVADNLNWGNGGDLPQKARIGFIKNIIRKLSWNLRVGASIDYQSYFHLRHVYKSLKNKGRNDMVVLGHPKNLSPASLRYFERFVMDVKDSCEFKTI